MDAPVPEQIAHQIGRAQGALSRLRDRYAGRVVEVSYGDVCADPAKAIRTATELVGVPWGGEGAPSAFKAAETGVEASLLQALETALLARPELKEEDL